MNPELAPIAHQVYGVIGRMRVSSQVEREELLGAGLLGYAKALAGFDPARGCKLKTYAEPCIRGTILDYLRSLDTVNHGLRAEIKAGRTADPGYRIIPLGETEPTIEPEAEQVIPRLDLARAMQSLTPRELFVLREQFWRDRNQREIARDMGVTPGYVSHVKIQACRKLAGLLNGAYRA